MSLPVRFLICLLALCAIVPDRAAGQDASRENELKAAYMYNFSRYVEWPESAFANSTAPFVIGVAGASAVEPRLITVALTKTVSNRPIRVVRIDQAGAVAGCHMLFLSSQVDLKLRDTLLDALVGKPVLLISEGASSAAPHGGFHFVLQENRLRVQVTAEQMRKRGLKISSKLLQVVEEVR